MIGRVGISGSQKGSSVERPFTDCATVEAVDTKRSLKRVTRPNGSEQEYEGRHLTLGQRRNPVAPRESIEPRNPVGVDPDAPYTRRSAKKMTPDIENKDEAMSDLSVMFHSFPEQPTYRSNLLDPSRLDYSTESLALVDDYLDAIRADSELDTDYNRTVLRAGAYVGEVLRRLAEPRTWRWLDFEVAQALDPEGWARYEKSISSCTILYRGERSYCFPLGKVAKFLENGREDSVKFFVEVMLTR